MNASSDASGLNPRGRLSVDAEGIHSYTGNVTCLSVIGNQASIGIEIVKSSDPTLLGQGELWSVVDRGTRMGSPVTRSHPRCRSCARPCSLTSRSSQGTTSSSDDSDSPEVCRLWRSRARPKERAGGLARAAGRPGLQARRFAAEDPLPPSTVRHLHRFDGSKCLRWTNVRLPGKSQQRGMSRCRREVPVVLATGPSRSNRGYLGT